MHWKKTFKLSNAWNPETIGGIAWVASVQNFIVQWWAASTWPKPYDPKINFISDLGNTSCGNLPGNIVQAARYVCSPEHQWVNASFVFTGFTIATGAVLLRTRLMPGKLGFLTTSLLIAAAVGIAMVGLNPENIQIERHIAGAYLNAYGASFGLILMGINLFRHRLHKHLAYFALGIGLLILFCNIFYTIGFYSGLSILDLGLGDGGMEKLCNYSIGFALIAIGIYALITQRQRSNSASEVKP